METLLLNILVLYYLFCLIWLIGFSELINLDKGGIYSKICSFILIAILSPILFPLALGASMSNINKIREEIKKLKNKEYEK